MSIVKTLISPLFSALTGGLSRKKPAPPPIQQGPVMQRPNSAAADAIAGRRGSRANQRSSGGEPSNGGLKNTLGS